jgi:endonuclease YncB( thermonuclease family)
VTKKVKKIKSWKKAVVTGALVASAGLGFWASKAFYTVTSVIDGDTFITSEKQYVRLDSVNAPETGLCMAEEAKTELSKLVLNKKVYIKVTYIDGMRLIASVYTLQGNVGELLLRKGLATFEDKGTQKSSGLLEVSNIARGKKVGVYSSICTQEVNPVNPKCNIKGNINTSNSRKYYRYPGCKYYPITILQLHFGDKWFCTEAEAKKSGFTKGSDCSSL